MTILSSSIIVHQCMMCTTDFNRCSAKLSTSCLLSCGPNSPEMNSVDYKIKGVTQQCEYQMQVNNTEEIKQWLSELRQSSNTALEWKDVFFMFCQVVQKYHNQLRWEHKSLFDCCLSNISAKNYQNTYCVRYWQICTSKLPSAINAEQS